MRRALFRAGAFAAAVHAAPAVAETAGTFQPPYPDPTAQYDSCDVTASGYSMAQDHFEWNSGRRNRYHFGEDWNGNDRGQTDLGDCVLAIADGVIDYMNDETAEWDNAHSIGKILVIRHTLPGGQVVDAVYYHLESVLPGLEEGDPVFLQVNQ